MLYDFNDRLVLDHRGLWFLWETAWDAFRPITTVSGMVISSSTMTATIAPIRPILSMDTDPR
jgi:hypothetical protein